MRTAEEITEVICKVVKAVEECGSKYPGMSYEDGVQAALDWVLENWDKDPMEDEWI